MDEILESPRLILRKFTSSDLGSILKVIGDPEVMKFSTTGPEDEHGGRKFLEACMRRYERDSIGQWAVILKETGQLIGECGISVQLVDGLKEFEISYRILRSLWGMGLGSEAAIACRDYGFDSLGLKRMISIIESENKPSIRVAQKMGMVLEKKSLFSNIPVEIYVTEKTAN
jgi:[ribosomal protein S5]-alanine N-acetyltransferase